MFSGAAEREREHWRQKRRKKKRWIERFVFKVKNKASGNSWGIEKQQIDLSTGIGIAIIVLIV